MGINSAFRNDNGAGKFALVIGLFITTGYVNTITIIFNSNLLTDTESLTTDLDFGAYLTHFRVYLNPTTNYSKFSHGYYTGGAVVGNIKIVITTVHIFPIFTIGEFTGHSESGCELTLGIDSSYPRTFIGSNLSVNVIAIISFITGEIETICCISFKTVPFNINLVADFTLFWREINIFTAGMGWDGEEYCQQGYDSA
ncbi:hypothetical protein ES703_51258 [subsurface metagenome]